MIVRGRVQGVFFRDTCRREAVGRGVAGWVRNRPDGAVEAVFEGAAENVEAMCAWCAAGPAYAWVEHVDVLDEQPRGEGRFRIRH